MDIIYYLTLVSLGSHGSSCFNHFAGSEEVFFQNLKNSFYNFNTLSL